MQLTKRQLWLGRITSSIFATFLVADGISHIIKPTPVVEAFHQLGLPLRTGTGLGVLVLACVALYVIPRTSHVGVVLLTGYLGGAVAIHLRAGDPIFRILFPTMVGAALWLGLFLRDGQLRRFILFKQ
jgi:hypothetical protein